MIKVAIAITVIYLISILCTSCVIKSNDLQNLAITICIYFLVKWISDYRLCTISWIECKIRGVDKKDGYINSVLDPLIDLNKGRFRYLLYFVVFVILLININIRLFQK